MASVYNLLSGAQEFYGELQLRTDVAENRRRERFLAVLLLQRIARGYLIGKHVAWLSENAATIQRAFRVHRARKAYRAALRRAVRNKHGKYYALAATRIQALWRGYYSRRTKFYYRAYRKWLAAVKEKGERRAAEAAEFGVRSRADDLKILEEEARKWLAFVVFKLHHLLRTSSCAGVYSEPATTELSDFEKLLKSIRYTDYMKRLRIKYEEFVKRYRPRFSNKRLFPIIGEGADYWYLSLPEMYELTAPVDNKKENTRHLALHHGPQHKEPFLWRKVKIPIKESEECRGPFRLKSYSSKSPRPPTSTPTQNFIKPRTDPRFHLYVKHYTPQPDLFDYVDYQVNVVLRRKCSIEKIDQEHE